MFSSIRRTNRVYPNSVALATDHASLVLPNQVPGFNLSSSAAIPLGNGNYLPGYTINGNVVSNINVNVSLRSNDVTSIRNIFPDASAAQINNLSLLRRADNIPDPLISALDTRRKAVKRSHPETATKTPEGVDQALQRNPRLTEYLYDAVKITGVATIVGSLAYVVIQYGKVVESLVDAINKVGGAYLYTGNNGADSDDTIQKCILRYRSCGINYADLISSNNEGIGVCTDPADATNVDPVFTLQQAQVLCNGYNLDVEQTVCRAADPTADPSSLRYYDPSTLGVNQTIECIEPYDLADLIADLGLDHLLGSEGVLASSSNASSSISNNLWTIVLVVGGVLLLIVVGYMMFKFMPSGGVATTTSEGRGVVVVTTSAPPLNVAT